MFPFSIWRDGVSSPKLSREVVAEAVRWWLFWLRCSWVVLGILQRDSVEGLIPKFSDCGFPGLHTT